MTKSIIIAALVLGMCGCAGAGNSSSNNTNEAAQNIVYVQDQRSGLCFAEIITPTYGGYQTVSLALVPCTPVEGLVTK